MKYFNYMGEDDWGRETYKDQENKTWKYVDGRFYSVSKDGEPDCPLKKSIAFKVNEAKE